VKPKPKFGLKNWPHRIYDVDPGHCSNTKNGGINTMRLHINLSIVFSLGCIALTALFGASDAFAAKKCKADAPWYGQFSGDQIDSFSDSTNPISARKCFRNEAECRTFIAKQSGKLNGGSVRIMSCRRTG
jgi:hypothetical protein